ncbi:MAG: 4'-phosphopantetheinyl transferase superfamily protein [Coprobacillus sp.]|nr:4'-phosphopantetheinyl transferase superfamily protein [Coprobacillus sp.]
MKMGLDIVSVSRISLEDKFVSHILSEAELALYKKKSSDDSKRAFLSGRWAAKEAFIKMNERPISYSEINVLNKDSGAPYILYDGKEYSCSISHEKEYAVALTYMEESL